ncbi:MAG TPA: flagellin [Acidobacteriaceae bacterium]|nr:flagellin [Acidobacteriaceae bacterium]
MSLSILNNIAALYAENNINSTQSKLQSTLQQLSSGSRINSGADDPAGLAVADGLTANAAALTQSAANATDGIGALQTADGALSQVTSLLDRAVTLATEASNGTLTDAQVSSANNEYQNILTQIGNIGATTNFNSRSVFSSTATNIVVTDGTSSGLNTYTDFVGKLATKSVGTTASNTPVDTTLTPVTLQAGIATTKVAGVYTLTPAASSDTLGGQFSFEVGGGNQVNITVAPGTTLATLGTQLSANSSFTSAGLTAAVSSGVLTITGPTSGANAAANAVTFTGTSLSDTTASAAVSGSVGTTASTGTAATGSLTVASALGGDTFAGTIILTQGSSSLTITVPAASTLGSASTPGTVQYAIAQAIAGQSGTNFAVATAGGTANNPIFNFTGDKNTTAITITGTLADTTASTSGTVTDNAGVAGTAPAAGTYTLSALGSATDTFGVSQTLTVGGQAISVGGLTGTQAAAAITANTTLAAAGITAAFNTTSKVLTITGNANGAALTVTGASSLTDVSGGAPGAVTNLVTGTAASGGAAIAAGFSTLSLLNPSDTFSGTLNVAVGTGATAKTASLVVRAGTTASQLTNAINQNAAFITAGVTAAYNTTTNAVTLTGPAGTTPSLDNLSVTGTLTDSTLSVPGAGVDFTDSHVSTLTALTASNVLSSVTNAIADVAYQRGTIGADVNELTSASSVASSEEVNLTSAQSSISATDYGQAASNLAKYQILSQTGISALAQANSVQQEVLKLLQ